MADSGWTPSRLGDLVEIKHGWPFKSEHYHEELTGQPIVVSVGNFRYAGGFRFAETSVKEYRDSYPAEYELAPGDMLLIMTCQTAGGEILGIPARVPNDGRIYLHNQRLGKVVIRRGAGVAPDFLYWVFLWQEFNRELVTSASGTKILHTAPSRIEAFRFDLPPVDEQHTIAHILGTLDDKIELNRRMNETLEAMARALFKSWFVDFDPVRAKTEGRDPGLPQALADLFPDSFEDSELGEIPRGWGKGTLGDFLCQRVERCSASPDTAARPYVPIDCISPKSLSLRESKPGAEAQSSLSKFYKGDILFGAMRPYFHKVCIAPFDGTTRTTAFVLYPRRPDDFAFATLQLHHPDTIDFATRHSTGSTIPYAVWTESLDGMPMIAPPPAVRKAFNYLVRPILARIPEPYFENRTLATLRDTLLSKLISGELRVKNTDRIAEIVR
ncbi:MAG: restriction endonuclease subunit S [Burkholderiales bacterium]